METSTFLKVFLGCAALVMALEISYLVRSRAYADPGGPDVTSRSAQTAELASGTIAQPVLNDLYPELEGCEAVTENLLADAGMAAEDSSLARDCDSD